MPYSEIGEFANIGVLFVCPQTGHWSYKLETQKHKRLTDFFKGLTQAVYQNAVSTIEAELIRLQKLHVNSNPDTLLAAFNIAVHPREAIIRFSEPRGRLTDNPEQELNRIFDHYV